MHGRLNSTPNHTPPDFDQSQRRALRPSAQRESVSERGLRPGEVSHAKSYPCVRGRGGLVHSWRCVHAGCNRHWRVCAALLLGSGTEVCRYGTNAARPSDRSPTVREILPARLSIHRPPRVLQLMLQAHACDREVYALEWHPKLPNVLATGSRDMSIKVSVRRGVWRGVLTGHVLALGVASRPQHLRASGKTGHDETTHRDRPHTNASHCCRPPSPPTAKSTESSGDQASHAPSHAVHA